MKYIIFSVLMLLLSGCTSFTQKEKDYSFTQKFEENSAHYLGLNSRVDTHLLQLDFDICRARSYPCIQLVNYPGTKFDLDVEINFPLKNTVNRVKIKELIDGKKSITIPLKTKFAKCVTVKITGKISHERFSNRSNVYYYKPHGCKLTISGFYITADDSSITKAINSVHLGLYFKECSDLNDGSCHDFKNGAEITLSYIVSDGYTEEIIYRGIGLYKDGYLIHSNKGIFSCFNIALTVGVSDKLHYMNRSFRC